MSRRRARSIGDVAPVGRGSCLPLPRPSSSLARPRSLMYSRSGHDRQAFRRGLTHQLVDLGSDAAAASVALRLVVVPVALLERRDVSADKPRLAPLDARVRVGQVRLARTDALYLRAGQDEAGLERIRDGVVVARLAVERHRFGQGVSGTGAKDISRHTNAGPLRAGVTWVLAPPRVSAQASDSPEMVQQDLSNTAHHLLSFPNEIYASSGRGRQSGLKSGYRARVGKGWPFDLSSRSSTPRLSTVSTFGSGSAGSSTTTSGVRPTPWIQVWSGVSHLRTERR